MWHELVQAGIGGRTVQEAKFAMSLDEFYAWQAYREKWGTLNIGARLDWLHARQIVQNGGLKNGQPAIKFADVLRYPYVKPEEKIATLADVASAIGLRI